MSLSLLEGLGIIDEALSMGLRVPRIAMQGFDEVPWTAEFAETSARFPFLLILPQGRFEGVLVRALKEEGVEVEWNRALSRIEEHPTKVICHLDHLADQAMGYAVSGMSRMRVGASRAEASYLIGTDGAWSTVRRELGIPWKITGAKRCFEVFEFAVRDSRETMARLSRKDGRLMALWPLPANRLRLTFEAAPGADYELGLRDLELQCEHHELVLDMPHELLWCSRVEFEPGMAESWGRGRCWLAGDSAHRALPHGVQSMNSGLTEGALLASRISDATDDKNSQAGFDEYATGRIEEWTHLLGIGTDPDEMERRAVLPATGRLHQQLLLAWHNHAARGAPAHPR
jgi:2-polyprenyl-6-methoxyphenol hydroxylase-like FAD-dependent oxidoreductase